MDDTVLKTRRPEHNEFPIREDGIRKIEVHVAGICAQRDENGDWNILAAKRSSNRSLFPDQWECGGGMVHAGESFPGALKRQMFEEFGLEVEPAALIETYEIHVPRGQRVIPGVRFLCFPRDGKIRLNEREFSTHKWLKVPLNEQVDWISGVKEAIDKAVEVLGTYYGYIPRKAPRSQVGFQAPENASQNR